MLPDHTLIVLGATGDLTGRLLLPAIVRLHAAGELPGRFAFVGAGPQPWDRASYLEHARARLAEHAADVDRAARAAFLDTVDYRQVDVADGPAVAGVLDEQVDSTPTGGSVTLYLALPTHLLPSTLAAFEHRKLPRHVRIAVEKPFGVDLPSAILLNAALRSMTYTQSQVYRVDHVLGMPAVEHLPQWVEQQTAASTAGAPGVAEVQILWEETLALEGRASFYDGAGALKDLLQNHLVQILCLTTIDPDDAADGEDDGQRRLRALRAVRVPTADEAITGSRRARYTSGSLATTGGAHGQLVPDYAAETGVDPGRGTETFAEVALRVSSPRWSSTRFVLRAGKALAARRRGVLLRWSTAAGPAGRECWIDVDRPTTAGQPAGAPPAAGSSAAPLEQLAYVTVLRNILSGASDLSVSAEETELAWRLFTPVLRAWAAGAVPLTSYPAGTDSIAIPPVP